MIRLCNIALLAIATVLLVTGCASVEVFEESYDPPWPAEAGLYPADQRRDLCQRFGYASVRRPQGGARR